MATSRSKTSARSRQPVERGHVRAGGHTLYFERHGPPSSPPVLLLHHGLGSVRSWRRQIPSFLEAGFQVLPYDRWGYGRSDPRPGFESGFLQHGAVEAVQLLDALGIERVHVLGHSDGGTIALYMAAGWPERVLSLIVVAAHIYYEPKTLEGLRGIEAGIRRPPLSDALEREHGERASQLATAWLRHWLESDIRDLNMRDQLRTVACPTLVIQGELDEHATDQHARDIAEGVRDGELCLMPGVRHMPMLEVPEPFNRTVIRFLHEHAGENQSHV